MELKDLDCPFCEGVGDWSVSGVEFVGQEVYMKAACPKCKKEVVISIPIEFEHMRMFITPKNKNVKAEMMPMSPSGRPAPNIEDEPAPATAPISEG